jgi:hypothetical protein
MKNPLIPQITCLCSPYCDSSTNFSTGNLQKISTADFHGFFDSKIQNYDRMGKNRVHLTDVDSADFFFVELSQ